MEKEKVHIKDIKEDTINEPRKIFVVGDKKYYADRISKAQLSTHVDCELCSKEFEKPYTHSKFCPECKIKVDNEKFLALPLVEWDEECPLVIWGDDKWFYSREDIEEFCDEHEIELSDLQLVTSYKTSFSEIDFEYWADNLHEDWDDKVFDEKLKEFNKFLREHDTNTWMPTNKRVEL